MSDWSTFNHSMLEWTKEFERQAKRYIDELVAEKVIGVDVVNKSIIKKHLSEVIHSFMDDNPVGGRLHVILEDLNISRSMIEYHLEHDELDEREVLICISMLSLNAKERFELLEKRTVTNEFIIEWLDEEDDKEEIDEFKRLETRGLRHEL